MNKIGLKKLRCKEGTQELLILNSDNEWTKKVDDIRDILKLYDTADNDKSKFAMFMRFSERGTYIIVAHPISGRIGDNIATWLFIPNNIDISGEEVVKFIKIVKKDLLATESDPEQLREAFSREYKTYDKSADFKPSSSRQDVFAVQDDCQKLDDLLGKKRYQLTYAEYYAILIENGNDSLKVVNSSVKRISTNELKETCVFCPPVEKENVSVYFDNGEGTRTSFNRPVLCNKGDSVKIVFNRAGFLPIPYTEKVCEDIQTCGIPNKKWKLEVKVEDRFKVRAASTGKEIKDNIKFTINGQTYDSYQPPITLTEDEAKKAKVTISADGYEPTTFDENFIDNGESRTIEMHRKERMQQWKIKLKDGIQVDMILKSKEISEDVSESPLEGYSAKGIILSYTPSHQGSIWKQRILGFCVAYILSIAIIWLYGLGVKGKKFTFTFEKAHWEYSITNNENKRTTSYNNTAKNPEQSDGGTKSTSSSAQCSEQSANSTQSTN